MAEKKTDKRCKVPYPRIGPDRPELKPRAAVSDTASDKTFVGYLKPQPQQCKTCIMRPDNQRLELTPERYSEILSYVAQGRQHICHNTGREGYPEARACRGLHDIQLRVFCAKGLIDAPTDEAMERANAAFLAANPDVQAAIDRRRAEAP